MHYQGRLVCLATGKCLVKLLKMVKKDFEITIRKVWCVRMIISREKRSVLFLTFHG